MNVSYICYYISTSGITTLHTQDIFLEKIKNHANNLIGDHICNYVYSNPRAKLVPFFKICLFACFRRIELINTHYNTTW